MAEAQKVQAELLKFLRETATRMREIALEHPGARPALLELVQRVEAEAADLEMVMVNSTNPARRG